MIPLFAIADDGVFHTPPITIDGVTYFGHQGIKLHGSEGEVRVRVRRDDALVDQVTYWSPGTLVRRGPAPNQQPMQPPMEQTDTLVCPTCNKICTSKPGLTLHRKSAKH